MNKEIMDEKADKLLEAEMIREAKLIEESLLGDRTDDTPISDEEVEKSYQRFLKRLKADGMLDDNPAEINEEMEADIKSAEIVQFPGKWDKEKLEKDKPEEVLAENASEVISEFSDRWLTFEKEKNKPWHRFRMTAGIALLAAIGVLAGSMAVQADSAKFVSTIQHIINNEVD